MVRVQTPLLIDGVKKSLLLLRYFWILLKQFLELVLIVVVICLNFKRYVHNIDTFAKKFKKSTNFFFMVIKKRHPKTFLLQDQKDACQPPALGRSTAGSCFQEIYFETITSSLPLNSCNSIAYLTNFSISSLRHIFKRVTSPSLVMMLCFLFVV